MENNIEFNNDLVFQGYDRVAQAVEKTMGAAGSNVIFQTNLPPYYIVTNDGKSIVDEAWFANPYQMMGANVCKEITKITNDESGDGRSTAISIGRGILLEGKDKTGIQLMQSMNECLPIIYQSIEYQKRLITSDNETIAIATISSESLETGKLITEIYKTITPEGIIELDNSRTGQTYWNEKPGLNFPQAFMVDECFATNDEKTKAEIDNPLILISDLPIATEADVYPIVERLFKDGKNNLVIACDKIGAGALAYIMLNHKLKKMNFLVIQAPTIMREFFFEDMAKATGATILSASTVGTLKNFKPEYLGTCAKIKSNREETRLLGIQDLSAHISALKELRQDGIMIERIRRLNTKVAVLFLAANSQSELKYKSKKTEDAINATKWALKTGYVPGGGVALLNASLALPDTIGGNLLRKALQRPITKIIENFKGNKSPESIIELLSPGIKNTKGFNAKTGEIVDMIEANIIDATTVTKNSVKTALSVAGTILSGEVTMAREIKEEGMRMPFPMM